MQKKIAILFISSLMNCDSNVQNKELINDLKKNVFNPSCIIRLTRALLTSKDTIDQDTFGGGNQLQDLAECNCNGMFKWFLESGADINKRGSNRKQYLLDTIFDNQDLLEIILEKRHELSRKQVIKSLIRAIDKEKSLETFKIFINDLSNEDKIDLLKYASNKQNKDYFKLLCSSGIDFRSTDLQEIFFNSISENKKNKEILNIMIDNGFDVNVSLSSDSRANVLHTAALLLSEDTLENREILNLILSKSKNINQQNELGQTALHIASAVGNSFIVNQLLSRGADIKKKDFNNTTPLDNCIRNNILIDPKSLKN